MNVRPNHGPMPRDAGPHLDGPSVCYDPGFWFTCTPSFCDSQVDLNAMIPAVNTDSYNAVRMSQC